MDIVYELEDLKESEVQIKVENRLREFNLVGKSGNKRWFSELSFCILTANFSARRSIDIQEELGSDGFIEFPLSVLETKLKELGHRFYRTRAKYIAEARKYSDSIKDRIVAFNEPKDARGWLVGNVKGIGYKEGSHFLRNVGYKDLMILDRHVLSVLEEWKVIRQIPKTLTKKRYMDIEREVEKLAENVQLSLAAIDLYIWYMDTGEILK